MNELTINRVPANKTEQKNMADEFVRQVLEGEVNPIQAVVQMKSLYESIGNFLKNEEVKECVIKECDQYGKGEYPTFNGATIQVKEAAVKYDFSECGDAEYNSIMNQIEELKEKAKEREKFLKTITKPTTIVDEETGEIVTLLPPSRQSTTTFAVTFKK